MDPFSSEGELLTPHTSLYQGQYSSVLDFDTNSLSPTNRTAAQILKYRAQIALGQSSAVLSSLSASAASSPDLTSVRALALYTSDKKTEALSALESLVEKEGENGTVQVLCGTVLALAERYEDALSLLSKHQGSLEAVLLTTQIHLATNRLDLAQREVTAAKKWAQDNLLVNLAEAWVGLRQGGSLLSSTSYYIYSELASTPSSSSASSLLAQGITELHLQRYDEASASLAQSLSPSSDLTPSIKSDALAASVVLSLCTGKGTGEAWGELQQQQSEHVMVRDIEEKGKAFDEAAGKWRAKVAAA
ncbi:MAG: hypothetical protein OHK93_005180 [Ramalina farinacea]|uniref:Coatomer subunit epsilon n=1 Tax=Ramalina farinacea TaxID=258253 RepID=A0AA43QXV5_9LECA|nr:hypothetical protein [Ramalina farinacea]